MHSRIRTRCWQFALTVLIASLTNGGLIHAAAEAGERRLRIFSVNTEERIDVVYRRDGEYVPEALEKIDWILRDWRQDEKIKMSRELIDLLWEVHHQVGSQEPIHLISGYRSQKTNNMLRRTKGGQARKSQHILGKAVDVHFPDVPVKRLRNAALIRQHGGVGYYPKSSIPFVHLDVGRVRHWPRLPRQELALLFPSAKTKHVPADGRRLRKKDVKVALAKFERTEKPLPWATRQQLKRAPRPLLASLGPVTSRINPEVQEDESPDAANIPTPGQRAPGRQTITRASLTQGADYDDDHPSELYYQPFPLLPMIQDQSIAATDFSSATPNLLKEVHHFFGGTRGHLVLRFEPGLQFSKLYRSSRFTGRAVSRILTRHLSEREPLPKSARLAQR